jgi:pimeloyl-ACP methyl ester carboxylesterase
MIENRVLRPGTDRIGIRAVGEGPLILLLHGIPGSSAIWSPVQSRLAALGFESWAPDLLGFGQSARPSDPEALWLEPQARAIADLLASSDAFPSVVVGHDYGVPLSIVLAGRAPERVGALVLAAGNVFTDTPIPLPLRLLAIPRLGRALARVALCRPALRAMLRLGSGRPIPAFDEADYLGDRRQQQAIRDIFSVALGDLEARYAPVERALASISVPTTVLWGDKDPFFPVPQAKRVAAAIRGARLELIRDAGHFLPAERPDELARAITRVASSKSPAS